MNSSFIKRDRIINSFLDLVRIDSESGHESALRDYLIQQFVALGLGVRVDKKGNLIAIKKGTIPSTILLSTHMDTVAPGCSIKPVVTKFVIRSDGTTILGSDDKSGIAEVLEVLAILQEQNMAYPTLKIVCTVEEEIGVKGARALHGITADYGFVLDVDGPIGRVVNAAPSHERFEISIIGKAAHAGIAPEKGIHAIQVASRAIATLDMGRLNADTTMNIGIIHGGRATNIVPDMVTIEGEVRSHREDELNKVIKTIHHVFEQEANRGHAKLVFRHCREYNSFYVPVDHKVVVACQQAAKSCKLPFLLESSNGGSDANFINTCGIPTVVLSTGMRNVHSVNESIRIVDMLNATRFLLTLVTQ